MVKLWGEDKKRKLNANREKFIHFV